MHLTTPLPLKHLPYRYSHWHVPSDVHSYRYSVAEPPDGSFRSSSPPMEFDFSRYLQDFVEGQLLPLQVSLAAALASVRALLRAATLLESQFPLSVAFTSLGPQSVDLISFAKAPFSTGVSPVSLSDCTAPSVIAELSNWREISSLSL